MIKSLYQAIGYSWFPSPPSSHDCFNQISARDKDDFKRGWGEAQLAANKKWDFEVSLEGSVSQIIEFHEGNLEELDSDQFKKVTFAILRKMNEKLENQ